MAAPERPAITFEGSATAVVDGGGRILLQQRDDAVPPAGYGRWCLPGGGALPAESAEQTARREFREETGITLTALEHAGSFDGAGLPALGGQRVHLFAAGPVAEEAIVVHEGLAFRYHTPREAAALAMNPGARALFEEALASAAWARRAGRAPLARVSVVVLNRWGMALLARPAGGPGAALPWTLPRGVVLPGESADAAALRTFEQHTGVRLDRLALARQGGGEHVYYIDMDLTPRDLAGEAAAYRLLAPAEVATVPLTGAAEGVLAAFFAGTAYRRLFH